MGNKPSDLDRLQAVRDVLFMPKHMCVDTRFVIRDGKRHPFAVICPGGGYYMVCSFIEGVPIAKKLNEKGISAFIVYYRVRENAHYPAPQVDLAAAIRGILKRKDRYMLDTDNYSVWGSSAGGHLAASFGLADLGYRHFGLPKPGRMVLSYPVISMRKDFTHQQSHDLLLGEGASEETETLMSIDEQVTSDYPPTYIWCGDADKTVPPENTKNMAAALESAGVPVSSEIFSGVDHGVGPGTGTAAEGWLDRAVDFWMAHKGAGSAQ